MTCCPRIRLFLGLIIIAGFVGLGLWGCSPDSTSNSTGGDAPEKTSSSMTSGTPSSGGSTATPAGEGPGSLSGRAVFTGQSVPEMKVLPVQTDASHCGAEIRDESRIVDAATRGLKNVVITIHGLESEGDAGGVTVANKGCRFDPHVAVARKGAEFTITNEDPVTHTTHPYADNRSLFNVPLVAGQKPVTKKLRRAGIIELKCDVHAWMQGWVVVHDNAYAAISAADGKFEIPDLPPGTYQVRAWHEELGQTTVDLTVKAGEEARLDFRFDDGKPVEAVTGESQPIASKVAPPPADSEPMFEVEAVSPLPGNQPLPLGLDPSRAIVPADNPITEEKVALGKALFFDPRLSVDDTVSCATCHDPQKGYSNGEAVATGVGGQKGGRAAPTIANRLFSDLQFWDGRAATVEHQALGPIENPIEMAMKLDDVLVKLKGIEGYSDLFEKAYGDPEITRDRIAKAIASYERTVVTGNSPWDRHEKGDESALTESQKRGLALFRGKAKCSVCHTGFNLTDEQYHNIGVGMDAENPDQGRAAVTKKPEDVGAFKTPTLRDVALTAPYFHDGSAKTLMEVVEFYDKGGIPNPTLSKNIFKLELTEQEKQDLVEIMKAFTGDTRTVSKAPPLPGK